METMTNEIFISTTTQRILAFLAIHSDEEFTEKEISRRTGVKKSATNLALRNLVRADLISRRKIGRSSLFKADISENLIREIKVLITTEKLSPLVKKLKKTSEKIALFGSAAAGTNTKDSDIDLFVLTNNPKNVRNIIDDSSLTEKIQLICKTPAEMVKINKKKPLVFSEIEKGRVLWEKNE
jgi:predicted nucleotidyltransferase